MLGHIAKGLTSAIPVMAVVAIIVFLLLFLSPGDPAAIMAGENATADTIAQLRVALGVDQPIHIRFWNWLTPILQGDLGNSIYWRQSVASLIGQRAGPTISLALTTLFISVCTAITLGVIAAARANSRVDRVIMGFAVVAFSVPTFVVGYLLIFVFSVKLGWLPVQGYKPLSAGFWPWLSHLILPSFTLGTVYVALIARITRASMLEVLSEDYIRTARAKGVPRRTVLFRHALKNAAVPIATIIGNGVAILISGVVITETVFNVPGIGRLVVDAIARRDYPIIQGVTLLFAGVYVCINLLVDLSYRLFDPRIRY